MPSLRKSFAITIRELIIFSSLFCILTSSWMLVDIPPNQQSPKSSDGPHTYIDLIIPFAVWVAWVGFVYFAVRQPWKSESLAPFYLLSLCSGYFVLNLISIAVEPYEIADSRAICSILALIFAGMAIAWPRMIWSLYGFLMLLWLCMVNAVFAIISRLGA